MELRHLRYFVAVAEEQNVTRAAARLNVSQPPLSRQIRDLEAELGVELFEHGAKSIRLTGAGRIFLEEARKALQCVDHAVQTVREAGGAQLGEIHVGFAPSLTVELLPRILKLVEETYPGMSVRLYDQSTQEMLRGLREAKLDVALIVQFASLVGENLVFEPLGSYPVCVAMHPLHPLARRRKVSLKEIAKERLIAFSSAEYPEYHSWLASLFSTSVQVVEEHDGVTSLVAAIEAGRGIALVSQRLDCFAGSRLKILPLGPAPSPLVVGIARRKGRSPEAIGKFIELVKRSASR